MCSDFYFCLQKYYTLILKIYQIIKAQSRKTLKKTKTSYKKTFKVYELNINKK